MSQIKLSNLSVIMFRLWWYMACYREDVVEIRSVSVIELVGTRVPGALVKTRGFTAS